ncbi:hypothetical protein BV25DRAFT_1834364 [Artomyces pyxidatus]|uniref:Uncharacterized protein n=1 Tax=Artomyces pyxidatus TaxID=48021 RepID=A0ACB8TI30_9AGAM|nr:hypothetical protein BV25DRAFT_1834364 [Artomyces pyxidatus]
MERAFSSWPSDTDEPPPPPPEPPKDKPKKPRHRHTAVQLAALNELYDKNEHPSLDQRTSLAERLAMETKTVNAWFQNKRASSKKRHRGAAAAPTFDLPPISALLASTSSTSTPNDFDDFPDNEHPKLPLPRIEKSPTQDSLPSTSSKQDQHQQQQTAFYAGNPEHRHTYESSGAELPPRPRMRMRPTSDQTDALRKFYMTNPHPSKEEREELGKRIGMRYQSVTNWFQNQRSMAKKRQEEDEEDRIFRLNQEAMSPAPTSKDASPPRSNMSINALLNRETRSPSAPPSNASVSSRASPYHNIMPAHRLRRTRPEPHQLEALQKLYNRTSNPSIEERGALALEVGMDIAKVTNWFRNLRQTARKRGRKFPDDGADTDSLPIDSTSVSRAATPSGESSSTGTRDPDHAQDIDADIDHIGGLHQDRDHDMETEIDETESRENPMEPVDTDLSAIDLHPLEKRRIAKPHSLRKHVNYVPRRPAAHSDVGTDDEEYQEAVTPSPPPSPRRPGFIPASFSPRPRRNRTTVLDVDVGGMDIDSVNYSRVEKIPERLTGVRVEDALLLLGFHQHISH